MGAFSSCVLRPLERAGFLIETNEDCPGKRVCYVFKTPLWRSKLVVGFLVLGLVFFFDFYFEVFFLLLFFVVVFFFLFFFFFF